MKRYFFWGGSMRAKGWLRGAVAATVVYRTMAQRGLPRVSEHWSPMGPPKNLRIDH